jgi:polar amino acid transport system substrate-binding protein
MSRSLLAVLFSVLLISGAAVAEQPVQLLVNTSPPYADRSLEEQGLALELVKHIFKRTDYQPEFIFESWSRAMEGVSLGLYDALGAAWYSESRSTEFLYSDPYLSSDLVLVKLRSSPADYFELSHLAGKRLGVRDDYAYGVDFESVTDLQLVVENHVIQNLLSLLNGSVDLVIGDQRTLALQMQEYLGKDVHKFEVVDIDLPVRKRHIAATRAIANEDKMIAAFNRALAEVRKDGSHAAIVAKWDKRYSISAD